MTKRMSNLRKQTIDAVRVARFEEASLITRAVSDHRESALAEVNSQDFANERVSSNNRFARAECLAPILLIYENVLSTR